MSLGDDFASPSLQAHINATVEEQGGNGTLKRAALPLGDEGSEGNQLPAPAAKKSRGSPPGQREKAGASSPDLNDTEAVVPARIPIRLEPCPLCRRLQPTTRLNEHVNQCLDADTKASTNTSSTEDAKSGHAKEFTAGIEAAEINGEGAAGPASDVSVVLSQPLERSISQDAVGLAASSDRLAKLQAWMVARERDNVWRQRLLASVFPDSAPAAVEIPSQLSGDNGAVSLLSWNLADDGLNSEGRSKVAPDDWTYEDNLDGFQQIIDHHKPMLLALQECRGTTIGVLEGTYCQTVSEVSHCGEVHLLVRRDIGPDADTEDASQPRVTGIMRIPQASGVAVCLEVPQSGHKLVVVSVHLTAGSGAGHLRLAQLKAAVLAVQQRFQTENVCILGDTNLRNREAHEVCQLTGGAVEVNLDCGPTWDSRNNLYHGSDAYQFACNFDRVFLKADPSVPGYSPDPESFQRVGDVPVTEVEGHYLSDHFGIHLRLLPQ